MIKNYFDKQFELRYFEMNEYGLATAASLLTLLEETAAEHCHSIDHGLFQLGEQDMGWILKSGIMEMERYPSYKEKITIRTWLSSYSAIKGIRENIIYDEQNNIIGRAKGLWVFFDIKRRRPIQILEDIVEKWSFCAEESLDYNISKKINAIEIPDYQIKFKVNRYDIDMNKHVNNIRYLQWVMDTVPDDIIDNYYLHAIDARFIAEATYGQSILSMTKHDDVEHSFRHSIQIEGTDIICATAKTIWKKIIK